MTKRTQEKSDYPLRWGRVYTQPSEYLIKLRKGKVAAHGPGLSVFIWPGESYTVLPTAIQRTTFVADQITAERVGVAVTGVAVYRIADPLLAFRLLDFGPDADGAEVLADTLREMFIGAARRLVANMTVEACLTRRKESIAQELMREIMPVVAGQGRPGDETDRGWGVVIDTIEIQDVRILSDSVFEHLQAPYRARLEQEAKESQVERDREIHLKEVEAQQTRQEADRRLEGREAEAEEQARLAALSSGERVELARLQQADRTASAQLAAELAAREREQAAAEALSGVQQLEARLAAELEELQAQEIRRGEKVAAEARFELRRLEAETAAALALKKAEAARLTGEAKAWVDRRLREVENIYSDERIRYELVSRALPAAAQALGECLGPVKLNLTNLTGAGDALQDLAGAVAKVVSSVSRG